jgi:hypothetical protein
MARIKTSGILSEISGSVSGMTFQQSLSGLTLRKKPLPLKINTGAQLNQRSSISYLQNLWFSLSQIDRNKWIYFLTWSKQAQNHNSNLLISGYQLFIKYQSARILAGLTPLTSFTFEPLNLPLISFEIYNSGSQFFILFSDYVTIDQYFFNMFLTHPVNVGTAYRVNGLRFMKVSHYVDRYYYIINPYLKAFGIIPLPGQQVNFRIYWFGANSPVLGFYQTGSKIIKST